MTAISRIRTSAALSAVLIAVATTTALVASSYAPKFFNDDPLWVEPETQDASGIKPDEVNLFVDLTANLLRGTRAAVPPGRARNINTVDEVPNSSWFTNRGELTPERIAAGANTTAGPAPGTWTVISSKSDGVTPGFTVTDAQGQRWFLKFDPPGYRGMSTGTEVAVSKLMWALGYNVAENHIAYMRREQLTIGAAARFTPPNGNRRGLREADIDALLDRVDREPDGSYRVVASKALAGKPIGRIRFVGTRPDDPNDLVPHQDRRELRGYGVFAAWLNHVDAKAINSLDTLVTENGRSFVRHHLIDFGSALGSGGVAAADYWAGDEYLLEPGEIGKRMIGFGFPLRRFHTDRFYESRSIGRLREDHADFNPSVWKPRVPNQAFLHARGDDRFWAARKLAALTTDMLRAAVKAGEFGDAEAEAFLVRALAQRRTAIVSHYLNAVNPIADVKLDESGALTFTNAAVDADVARAPREYRAAWSEFDNLTGGTRHIGETTGRTTELAAPAALPREEGVYVKVAVSASGGPNPAWEAPVDAYFRRCDGAWRLIGFERLPAR
jgi:hypothetical protein